MKIFIKFEESDILKAIEKHPNGDAFRLFLKPNDDEIYLGYGDYCLVNLIQGAEYELHKLIEKNNRNPILLSSIMEITPHFKLKLLMQISEYKAT